ncbi:hypothetical protein M011DRAFT_474363 [Sporormia fimetaria CBS 119925]|uniref:Uncharacterized protein n=1 Tax=Sporormia fimetaria CBS 119925 TaxID=1340428 RepID=A0A6A6VNS0_9PLEO|nr:hypothetical protein M011DRAFT_474363 [Sporormia fimetaria CBS 119925]
MVVVTTSERQEFCTQILNTFPLEIRGKIYGYLIYGDEYEPPQNPDKALWPWTPGLRAKWYGEVVAKELAIWYYRNIEFAFFGFSLEDTNKWLEQLDRHGNVRGEHVLHANLTRALLYPNPDDAIKVRKRRWHPMSVTLEDRMRPTFLELNICPRLSLKRGATIVLEPLLPWTPDHDVSQLEMSDSEFDYGLRIWVARHVDQLNHLPNMGYRIRLDPNRRQRVNLITVKASHSALGPGST